VAERRDYAADRLGLLARFADEGGRARAAPPGEPIADGEP